MDTGQVLEEIKRGNSEAFKLLFKAYYPRLPGYALRFIQNEEEAKDLVQECFCCLLGKTRTFKFRIPCIPIIYYCAQQLPQLFEAQCRYRKTSDRLLGKR